MADGNNFVLESHGVKLTVKRLNLPGYVAFRVEFSSIREPLVLARATHFEAHKFWTSIPEGRQAEAEGVGELIENYLKTLT